MNRPRAALLLLAASTLPGCFFARSCIPMDAKGMEMPLHWYAEDFDEQVRLTSARVRDLPADLADHVEDCRRHLTTYPGE